PDAVSRLGERNEGIVAPEQDLRGRDKARQCRDRRSIGCAGNVVVESFEFVFDSGGGLLAEIFASVLVHASEHHRHVSTRVGEDEAHIPVTSKTTGKEEICYRARGVLWDLDHYG